MPPEIKKPEGSQEVTYGLTKPPSSDEGFSKEKARITPKVVSSPVKAYTVNVGRSRVPGLQWEAPEWDLAECGRIIDVEGYVRRAFAVKQSLFLKEGYSFTGRDPARVRYVRKRLLQMEEAGGVPFSILMSWTVGSLIRMSNAFWVKKRNFEASGGNRRQTVTKKTLDPVAAYFPLQAETVRFLRDEFGKIYKYRQVVPGKTPIDFSPEDIVHFYYNKREGFSVGTPDLVPIKDDIRALRRIEENVELLVYQHLFPLFHYKVGTESAPAMTYPDGTTEIDAVISAINNMPSDGCWVTPERHSIDVKGAEGEALKIKEIIDHFKKRIFTGLGVSSIDMGEGETASRSTAQTLSRNLVDRVKAEQVELASFINKYIIEELLLESTFEKETLFNDENRVLIEFNEIDREARIALENHLSQMYLQHYLTHDQMRLAGGEEPWTEEDWEKSYFRQIDEPIKLMQSLDEPFSAASQAIAQASTTSITEEQVASSQQKAEEQQRRELAAKKPQALPTRKSSLRKRMSTRKNKVGSNRNQPSNQHKTRTAPKLNKDTFADSVEALRATSISSLVEVQQPIASVYEDVRRSIVSGISSAGWDYKRTELVVGISFEEAKDRLATICRRAYRYGVQDTRIDSYRIRLDTRDVQIDSHVSRYVKKLRDEILYHLRHSLVESPELSRENAALAAIILDAMEHRTKMIDLSEIVRAYNAGLADGYRKLGATTLVVRPTSPNPCDQCKQSILQWTEADAIIYEELPPLHPHCTCLVKRG